MDKIELYNGDITEMHVDVIVNAANKTLLGGGGVDGAIHRAAGHRLKEECMSLNGCETGQAKITNAYRLPSRYVIHAVGPVWYGGENQEAEMLASAYRSSLELAKKHKLRTIAFPNISTGVYHFPKQLAAEITISTVRDFLNVDNSIEQVFFCVFDEENYPIYEKLLGLI